MNEEREILDHQCRMMGIGQWLDIGKQQFNRAYPCGWPSIYENHEQAFLSSMIGSAWGCYTVDYIFEHNIYRIKRHEAQDKRVYVDPDRRDLYVEINGEYIHREVLAEKEIT